MTVGKLVNYLWKMVQNKKIANNMKIVFNIKFIALTPNITKISENIKSDVVTSTVASPVGYNND